MRTLAPVQISREIDIGKLMDQRFIEATVPVRHQTGNHIHVVSFDLFSSGQGAPSWLQDPSILTANALVGLAVIRELAAWTCFR